MAESRHASTAPPGPDDRGASREAQIDELLLAGLDHYFAGRYQDATAVWGRVLFLDRTHERARAYIERARGALAECQRRSEQLVQEGVAALGRGEESVARQLLNSVAGDGEASETARAYLDRLERLSGERSAQVRSTRAGRVPDPEINGAASARPVGARRPVRALPILAMAVAAGAIILFATSKDPLKPLFDLKIASPAGVTASARAPEPLPLPRGAELALSRARAMYRAGQLKAALAALDGVNAADPLSGEARRLRAEIQLTLLGSAQSPAAGRDGEPAAADRGAGERR